MVGVFLFLLHPTRFREHGLKVVGISVIPRHDVVVTLVAHEAKPLSHSVSSMEMLSDHYDRRVDPILPLAARNHGPIVYFGD
jgi:hypothetical protein